MTRTGSFCAWVLLMALAACRAGQQAAGDGGQASPALDGSLAQKPTAPPPLTYAQRQGQRLFRHYCAVCHGDQGAGDGFNAWNLNPRPRDLADPAYQRAVSDAWLTEVTSLGGLAVNKSNLMPAWKNTLSPTQIAAVVAFVRTLDDSSLAASAGAAPPQAESPPTASQ